MIDFIDRKAKDLFEDLMNEVLSSISINGTEYRAGYVCRYMSSEEFESMFSEFIDKCREETLIVKTRSTDPSRKEIWSDTMDEFVILRRAKEIVENMEI